MDQENRLNLQNLWPEQSDKLHLLTEYSLVDLAYDYVPDPYYTRNFNEALDIIEASLNGFVKSANNLYPATAPQKTPFKRYRRHY